MLGRYRGREGTVTAAMVIRPSSEELFRRGTREAFLDLKGRYVQKVRAPLRDLAELVVREYHTRIPETVIFRVAHGVFDLLWEEMPGAAARFEEWFFGRFEDHWRDQALFLDGSGDAFQMLKYLHYGRVTRRIGRDPDYLPDEVFDKLWSHMEARNQEVADHVAAWLLTVAWNAARDRHRRARVRRAVALDHTAQQIPDPRAGPFEQFAQAELCEKLSRGLTANERVVGFHTFGELQNPETISDLRGIPEEERRRVFDELKTMTQGAYNSLRDRVKRKIRERMEP